MKEKLRAEARFSDNGSRFAADGRYRHWLDIRLEKNAEGVGTTACVIGMNPSTARVENGLLVPDPTVTRFCGFARREGCARLIVVNAFGVRLTESRLLHKQVRPVGNPLNDMCIRNALHSADVRIVAWGRLHKDLAWRDRELRELLRRCGLPLRALKVNDDGSPGHALYLAADSPLFPFTP